MECVLIVAWLNQWAQFGSQTCSVRLNVLAYTLSRRDLKWSPKDVVKRLNPPFRSISIQMSRRPAHPDVESQLGRATDEYDAGAAPGSSGGPPNGDSRDQYLDRLVEAAKAELLYTDSQGNTILNLATLQRMLLFHLQAKIIEGIGPLAQRKFGRGNPLDGLKTAMADYGNSWFFSLNRSVGGILAKAN